MVGPRVTPHSTARHGATSTPKSGDPRNPRNPSNVRELKGRPLRHAPTRLTALPRGRRPRHLMLGLLLVVGCATTGVFVGTRLGDSEEVLALARPVTVGHKLRARDLREISITADSGLPVLAARSRSRLEGRPVAYSLPAGALLTEAVVGEARVPPHGAGIVAIGLKAGQFPPGLQPGNRVTVVMTSREPGSTTPTAASSTSWSAIVIAVGKLPNEQTTVASLQMDTAAARQLATAREGEVTVVIVNGGRT